MSLVPEEGMECMKVSGFFEMSVKFGIRHGVTSGKNLILKFLLSLHWKFTVLNVCYIVMILNCVIIQMTITFCTCIMFRGSVHRESMSIIFQKDTTKYSFYSLQTAVHVSGDSCTHHQEHM
jgi:hypothetical protein